MNPIIRAILKTIKGCLLGERQPFNSSEKKLNYLLVNIYT